MTTLTIKKELKMEELAEYVMAIIIKGLCANEKRIVLSTLEARLKKNCNIDATWEEIEKALGFLIKTKRIKKTETPPKDHRDDPFVEIKVIDKKNPSE